MLETTAPVLIRIRSNPGYANIYSQLGL